MWPQGGKRRSRYRHTGLLYNKIFFLMRGYIVYVSRKGRARSSNFNELCYTKIYRYPRKRKEVYMDLLTFVKTFVA